jgi:hypothetical protein
LPQKADIRASPSRCDRHRNMCCGTPAFGLGAFSAKRPAPPKIKIPVSLPAAMLFGQIRQNFVVSDSWSATDGAPRKIRLSSATNSTRGGTHRVAPAAQKTIDFIGFMRFSENGRINSIQIHAAGSDPEHRTIKEEINALDRVSPVRGSPLSALPKRCRFRNARSEIRCARVRIAVFTSRGSSA